MMKPVVYLAGPITGLSFEGCTDWREFALKELGRAGIDGFSPMRAKEALKGLQLLSGTGEEYQHLTVFATQRGVMTRDRFDCMRCDVLLVNLLGAKSVSIGTVMEIAWADARRTPIVCAIEESGNPHEHMMIREALGFRVPSLEEALNCIKAILLPKVPAFAFTPVRDEVAA
jgi:nucleoside 2-deoxyribosyltransferase